MFFVKLLASFLLSLEVREQAQTMWIAMGEGGSCNVHFTNKAYLVKLFTKGEGGGHKSPKKLSTWFVHAPYPKWGGGENNASCFLCM